MSEHLDIIQVPPVVISDEITVTEFSDSMIQHVPPVTNKSIISEYHYIIQVPPVVISDEVRVTECSDSMIEQAPPMSKKSILCEHHDIIQVPPVVISDEVMITECSDSMIQQAPPEKMRLAEKEEEVIMKNKRIKSLQQKLRRNKYYQCNERCYW